MKGVKGVQSRVIRIEVKEGRAPWVIGIMVIAFGILCSIICLLYPDKSAKGMWYYYLGICLFAFISILSGLWLCISARNRKLIVEDEKLSYVNCFGKKRAFILNDIAGCRTAMPDRKNGNKDYLALYDRQDKKLCKLDYGMTGCLLFLQYLIDNQVKIECTGKPNSLISSMLDMERVTPASIADVVNGEYDRAKAMIHKWTQENEKLGVEWKLGIAAYLESEIIEKKQLWEQKGCDTILDAPDKLPEGCIIAIESYLLKEGEFVINAQGWAVCGFSPIISVSKSLKAGEGLKINHDKDALDGLGSQLAILSAALPRNRYHTEALKLKHELRDGL